MGKAIEWKQITIPHWVWSQARTEPSSSWGRRSNGNLTLVGHLAFPWGYTFLFMGKAIEWKLVVDYRYGFSFGTPTFLFMGKAIEWKP